MWIILCILLTILFIFAFPVDGGVDGYAWMPIIACILAIIFGISLLLCCKIYADKLSWRKRLLMYSVLDNLEQN